MKESGNDLWRLLQLTHHALDPRFQFGLRLRDRARHFSV